MLSPYYAQNSMVYVTFYFHFYCRIADDQDMDLNTSLMSFDNLLDYYDTGIHGGILTRLARYH